MGASLDGYYGVNVQQVFGGSASSWQPQLSAIASGGLQLARIDARWANVEPSPPSGQSHSYNWSQYDSMVQAMAQAGLRWYPIVGYSTPWAGVVAGDSSSVVAPAHVGDFAAFASALARRYGQGGSFWSSHPSLPRLPVENYEIWNEENSSNFMHPQDAAPEAYADLYMTARAAIKAVDPNADVVVGGLALGTPGVIDEEQFIQRMYAHRPDLVGHVDGVGLHPYQSTVADTYMRLAKFRQALDQLAGPGVPIEITEMGWATTSVPDAQRAADLTQLAEELPRSDCNVNRFLPYTWLTQESDPSNPEDWFGIWNRNGTAKPSGQAFLDAVRLMRGMTAQPPPAGAVTICHPAPAQSATPGPQLSVHVVRVRRRHFVVVAVRCQPACTLRLDLIGKPRRAIRGARRVATRGVVLHTHRTRRVKLRIRHAGELRRRARVRARAAGPNGGVTVRSRRVRIR